MPRTHYARRRLGAALTIVAMLLIVTFGLHMATRVREFMDSDVGIIATTTTTTTIRF